MAATVPRGPRQAGNGSRPQGGAKVSRPRGPARRDALLDAVIRIVAEVGADAVTHRRVAEVADLPLASTTYWFESKEHLLTAALERAADRDIARLHAFIGADALDAPEDVRDRPEDAPEDAPDAPKNARDAPPHAAADPIALAVEAILDSGGDESGQAGRGSLLATYALLLEAARRPALRAVTRRWTDAYLEALGRLLAMAGSPDPPADAALLLAAADGLLVEHLASGENLDLRGPLRRLGAALVKS